jgi:hypothetical protein
LPASSVDSMREATFTAFAPDAAKEFAQCPRHPRRPARTLCRYSCPKYISQCVFKYLRTYRFSVQSFLDFKSQDGKNSVYFISE